ncbi:MAG: hydantoinase/oxoprolinase family protein [Candidatus Porifericomitaceae bacterium WSBS_2022_MAG_OTU9]
MNKSYIAAWDVGGSHLKLALLENSDKLELVAVMQWPMPIWQGLEVLRSTFAIAMKELPVSRIWHVASMTAELSDIFPDRELGVLELLAQLCSLSGMGDMDIYCKTGLIKAKEILLQPKLASQAASANWHATLRHVAAAKDNGILLDVGGSTTDILPFVNYKAAATGNTDQERLANGELLYSGVVRTPVAMVCNSVPYHGKMVRLCNERFADMADVYRFLGMLAPQQDLQTAADGRGKDMIQTGIRLARMIGLDRMEHDDLALLANWVAESQLRFIDDALMQVLSRHRLSNTCLVAAGVGAWLVHKLAERHALNCIDISGFFSTINDGMKADVTTNASAVALAFIAASEQV